MSRSITGNSLVAHTKIFVGHHAIIIHRLHGLLTGVVNFFDGVTIILKQSDGYTLYLNKGFIINIFQDIKSES